MGDIEIRNGRGMFDIQGAQFFDPEKRAEDNLILEQLHADLQQRAQPVVERLRNFVYQVDNPISPSGDDDLDTLQALPKSTRVGLWGNRRTVHQLFQQPLGSIFMGYHAGITYNQDKRTKIPQIEQLALRMRNMSEGIPFCDLILDLDETEQARQLQVKWQGKSLYYEGTIAKPQILGESADYLIRSHAPMSEIVIGGLREGETGKGTITMQLTGNPAIHFEDVYYSRMGFDKTIFDFPTPETRIYKGSLVYNPEKRGFVRTYPDQSQIEKHKLLEDRRYKGLFHETLSNECYLGIIEDFLALVP
ncbi:MAG: hypothetical protein ACEQSA_00625 [Weeksellaceae bacterium]